MSGPGFSQRLSRYTPAFFFCAVLNLLLAELLAAAGLTWPAQPLLGPGTLAVVHLTTLGWLTLLMFGALFQFVPVIGNRALRSQRLMLGVLVVFELGLALLLAGFAALSAGLALRTLLPVGGGLVLLAVLLAQLDLLPVILGAVRHSLPARAVLAGTGFLLLTLLLGLAFTVALRLPARVPHLVVLMAGALAAHPLAGIGGWFTLTAIGVSYKLLSMFMLAPEERGATGEAVLLLVAGGFAVAVVATMLHACPAVVAGHIVAAAAPWQRIAGCGLALAAAGVLLYLYDVLRLYRGRRRRVLELHSRSAVAAFVFLLATVPLALWWRLDAGTAAAATLVVLALGGWLTGLGLTQLYKIIVFLSWLTHYGDKLGRGAVPRVQDLVDERRARPWFALFYVGAVLLSTGAALAAAWLFQSGAGLCFVGTLALAREYRRGWRLHYAQRDPVRRDPASREPGRRTTPAPLS